MCVLFCSLFFSIGVFPAFGSVVLIGSNVTLSFENTEANFGEFNFSIFVGILSFNFML